MKCTWTNLPANLHNVQVSALEYLPNSSIFLLLL